METKTVIDALREVPLFAGLSEEQIAWFADHSEDLRNSAGDIIAREGDPAEWLFVLLTGSIRVERESKGPDGFSFVGSPGDVGGALPFSRMTLMGATIRAITPTWGIRLHKNDFAEMLEKIPPLLPRLIAVMADRIKEVTRVDEQHAKLMALGKFSAGLAHELNNPASAPPRLRRSSMRYGSSARN